MPKYQRYTVIDLFAGCGGMCPHPIVSGLVRNQEEIHHWRQDAQGGSASLYPNWQCHSAVVCGVGGKSGKELYTTNDIFHEYFLK